MIMAERAHTLRARRGITHLPFFLFSVLIASTQWFFAPLLFAQGVSNPYSETAFQLNAASLPPLYKGHDVVRLSEVLAQRKANAVKGEFETSAQWRARLNAEEAAPTVGTLLLSSLYAFALDDGRLTDEAEDPARLYRYRRIQAEYNADKSAFDVYIAFGEGVVTAEGKLDKSESRTLTVAQTSLKPYYEVRNNAFGGTVTVEVNHDTLYELLGSDLNDFPTAQHDDRSETQVAWLHAAFTAPNDQAKAIKQNIAALAICTLQPPFFRAGKLVSIGTFDSPLTQFIDYNYINVDVVSLWIYDTVSGKVYARVAPTTSLK